LAGQLERRKKMKTYNITITFKSKCSESDLKDDDDLIYKFVNENFWNVENCKYEYKEENKTKKISAQAQ